MSVSASSASASASSAASEEKKEQKENRRNKKAHIPRPFMLPMDRCDKCRALAPFGWKRGHWTTETLCLVCRKECAFCPAVYEVGSVPPTPKFTKCCIEGCMNYVCAACAPTRLIHNGRCWSCVVSVCAMCGEPADEFNQCKVCENFVCDNCFNPNGCCQVLPTLPQTHPVPPPPAPQLPGETLTCYNNSCRRTRDHDMRRCRYCHRVECEECAATDPQWARIDLCRGCALGCAFCSQRFPPDETTECCSDCNNCVCDGCKPTCMVRGNLCFSCFVPHCFVCDQNVDEWDEVKECIYCRTKTCEDCMDRSRRGVCKACVAEEKEASKERSKKRQKVAVAAASSSSSSSSSSFSSSL
jgi:hypothetical protein